MRSGIPESGAWTLPVGCKEVPIRPCGGGRGAGQTDGLQEGWAQEWHEGGTPRARGLGSSHRLQQRGPTWTPTPGNASTPQWTPVQGTQWPGGTPHRIANSSISRGTTRSSSQPQVPPGKEAGRRKLLDGGKPLLTRSLSLNRRYCFQLQETGLPLTGQFKSTPTPIVGMESLRAGRDSWERWRGIVGPLSKSAAHHDQDSLLAKRRNGRKRPSSVLTLFIILNELRASRTIREMSADLKAEPWRQNWAWIPRSEGRRALPETWQEEGGRWRGGRSAVRAGQREDGWSAVLGPGTNPRPRKSLNHTKLIMQSTPLLATRLTWPNSRLTLMTHSLTLSAKSL